MVDWFDVRTLMATVGTMNFVLALVMLGLSISSKTFPGFRVAMVGFFAAGVGDLLICLRGQIPDFLSIVIANGLILTLPLAVFIGLLRFLGRQLPLFAICFVYLLFTASFIWFTYFQPSVPIRIFVVTFIATLFVGMTWLFAWIDLPSVIGRRDGFSLSVIGLIFCVLWVRSLAGLFLPIDSGSFFDMGAVHYVLLLLVKVLMIMWMCSLVNLNTLRMQFSLAKSEEKLLKKTKELMLSNQKLHDLSWKDSLTGVGNRRFFDEHLLSEWKKHQRAKQPISLILCDVDHFKAFNDTYGHPMGDRCLQAIASCLVQVVKRSTDYCARYGGEEFAIILTNTDSAGAERVAKRLLKVVRDYPFHRLRVDNVKAHAVRSAPVSTSVTISMGVVTHTPIPQVPPELLLTHADRALYESKQKGRDCFQCAVI